MELVISSHMSYAWSKGALNYCIRGVGVENLNVAQWKHLSSKETLLKPFAHQMNVTSSKWSVCVVLVPSC